MHILINSSQAAHYPCGEAGVIVAGHYVLNIDDAVKLLLEVVCSHADVNSSAHLTHAGIGIGLLTTHRKVSGGYNSLDCIVLFTTEGEPKSLFRSATVC